MEGSERQACGQFCSFLKIFIRLSGKTDDHVRTDRRERQGLANAFHTLGVMIGAIPTMHGAKDLVGTGLQWHMKMRCQAIRRGHHRYEFLGDVLWLDGTQPKLFEKSLFQNAMNDLGKTGARREIATVRAKVDATENYFS